MSTPLRKPTPKQSSTPRTENRPLFRAAPAESTSTAQESETPKKKKSWFRVDLKTLPNAYWTITGTISLLINAVLITVLISVTNQLFTLNQVLQDRLVTPLGTSFNTMYEASIQTSVNIDTTVPARFDLPLDTDTVVVLSEDTFIQNARVTVNTGGLSIQNSPADILLPAGTQLPIHLNLTVPVDQTIPVAMTVPVNIPLKDTSLGTAFASLVDVVEPYDPLLKKAPQTWTDMICNMQTTGICHDFFWSIESILTK